MQVNEPAASASAHAPAAVIVILCLIPFLMQLLSLECGGPQDGQILAPST
jgi:hypothetical protein